MFGAALVALSASPALAYWQFTSYRPNGERTVHGRFSSQRACEAALKRVDAQLTKQYPTLFPRVGSCQEFR
jgi:hypothetical protein